MQPYQLFLPLFANGQEATVEGMAELFDTVLNHSYDGIYVTDAEANTVLVNKSYETISGLRRADLIGRNMRDLVREGIISQSGTLLVMEGQQAVTLEQNFSTGKRAVITSTPCFDAAGALTMVVTNVRDVTDLHHLQQRLYREEQMSKLQLLELEAIRKQFMDSGEMIAVDQVMLGTLSLANRAARTDASTIVLGETGTGKEVIAAHIHKNSARAGQSFIKINCGAISEQLVESELFGYERGAFTGADKEGKPGLFEVAHRGTIFLDEIAELPAGTQVKLLRVLQEQEVLRVGSIRPKKVDVRIIAATNRSLEEMVKAKRFREDLYYRLNVIPITVPPLRERFGDILPLANHFLRTLNQAHATQKKLSNAAELALLSYHWPGNVRELRNVIERAMILSRDDVIKLQDLAIVPSDLMPLDRLNTHGGPICLKETLANIERQYIESAYKTHGNIRAAAQSLGMDPATYLRRKRRYAVED